MALRLDIVRRLSSWLKVKASALLIHNVRDGASRAVALTQIGMGAVPLEVRNTTDTPAMFVLVDALDLVLAGFASATVASIRACT